MNDFRYVIRAQRLYLELNYEIYYELLCIKIIKKYWSSLSTMLFEIKNIRFS